MSTKWRKEHIEKFIFFVKPHFCLYSVNSLEFLDRNLKAQAFNEILAQMREYIPNISVDDMKKKLRNLRTQFMHEQRMVIHSKKSGCGRSDVYLPKLWCYDQLSFLKNQEAIRKPRKKVVKHQKIKKSTKWKREHMEKFIFCVQQHPCLYNLKSLEYLDGTLRAQAFNVMLAQMQECIPNISVVDLKKKLRNLRTMYMHEERLVNNSIKRGCGSSDVYVPKLWCYELLSFLKNQESITPGEDDMEDSNVPPTSGEIAEQGIVDERCKEEIATLSDCENTSSSFCKDSRLYEKPPMKPQAKKDGQRNEFLQKIDSFQKCILSQRKTPKKFEWLGNLVATQMDDIDPEDQQDAAWTVQCLMRELISNAGRNPIASASSSPSGKSIMELSMAEVVHEPDYM